jgi:leucyl-tRNA synthetase
VKVIIQVNGKMRGSVMLKLDATQDEAVLAAQADANVQTHVQGKTIAKVIHVPNRLLNIVVE